MNNSLLGCQGLGDVEGHLSNFIWETLKRKPCASRKCRETITISPKLHCCKYITDHMFLLGRRRQKLPLHKHHIPPSENFRMPKTSPLCILLSLKTKFSSLGPRGHQEGQYTVFSRTVFLGNKFTSITNKVFLC